MPVAMNDLRVMLIQIRDGAEVARHEQICVIEQSGLEPERVRAVNVVTERVPHAREADDVHIVIIGGAGAHSACDDDHFTGDLIRFVRAMADRGKPMLGCCWGHQFIARALGGEVIHDAANAEVGAVKLELTAAGMDDAVFGACPHVFPALAGHHDRVSRLPRGGVELARNDGNPNQAFCIEGTMIYGTQFHSELTPERLIERLSVYRHYMPDDSEFDELRKQIHPTPDARRILRRYLEIAAQRIGA
ncbi:MAG: type 1 glutamine amidotransferase [Phycisphaeraceae bacterium]|nr:type 1 glutamine amidotransferase [Phycisphaerales bacterium]MCB9842714.1 type 1 glutamine amidotransferase [Phycisphaeraceae bacterium]